MIDHSATTRRTGIFAPLPLLLLLCCYAAAAATTIAQEQAADPHHAQIAATPPATAPATQPATQPADVSPEAQALLGRVRNAYASLDTLNLTGTFALELDVAGRTESKQLPITGSFQAPNRFRHEAGEDAIVVSTGSKAYLYVPRLEKYLEADAPERRAPSAGLEGQIADVLRMQNPSLYLALCADAADELIDEAISVATTADGRLRIQAKEQVAEITLESQTHLIQRLKLDMAESLRARGVPDVKVATITVDYTTTTPRAAVDEQQFAWSVPDGATLARDTTAAVPGTPPGAGEAQALQGQAAPDFTLVGLDGRDVTLKGLRGSVVVLDFWASWCGPCRAALPHLDELQREFRDQDLKILAVNVREPKATAQKFVDATGLKLPVLLDESGKVAQAYAVGGIPQTVVIDKSGRITSVIVGFSPGGQRQLREAIQKANGPP